MEGARTMGTGGRAGRRGHTQSLEFILHVTGAIAGPGAGTEDVDSM